MGLSCGHASCGKAGYAPFKAVIALGIPLKVAALLAHLFDLPDGAVVADSSVEERVKYTFGLRPVDLVYLPLLGEHCPAFAKGAVVYALQGRKELQEDEWLYQVQEGARPEDWDAVFAQIAAAETVEGAQRCLTQYIASHPDDRFAARLRGRMGDWRPGFGVALCEGCEPASRHQPTITFR